MCYGGGGGQRATIVMPDTSAYDRQFDMQKTLIESQMNSSAMTLQQELQGALRKKESLLSQMAEAKTEQANSQRAIDAQALRMASLIGAPPPEKSATAPSVGDRDRGLASKKGKQALRITRAVATSSGQGSGLNIT